MTIEIYFRIHFVISFENFLINKIWKNSIFKEVLMKKNNYFLFKLICSVS